MKDFENWMKDTGKSEKLDELNSTLQKYVSSPMTQRMGFHTDRLKQSTTGMEDSTIGQKRILASVWKQVNVLDPLHKRKLAQALIQSLKDPVEDQAHNPKARYRGN